MTCHILHLMKKQKMSGRCNYPSPVSEFRDGIGLNMGNDISPCFVLWEVEYNRPPITQIHSLVKITKLLRGVLSWCQVLAMTPYGDNWTQTRNLFLNLSSRFRYFILFPFMPCITVKPPNKGYMPWGQYKFSYCREVGLFLEVQNVLGSKYYNWDLGKCPF